MTARKRRLVVIGTAVSVAGAIAAGAWLLMPPAARLPQPPISRPPPPFVPPVSPQDRRPVFETPPPAPVIAAKNGRRVRLADGGVIDGDTLWLSDGGRVLVHGIDAPEVMVRTPTGWVAEPEVIGIEALERSRELLGGGEFAIVPTGRTSYDRTVACVVAQDSLGREFDLAEVLLREGHGWFYDGELSPEVRERYLAAQNEAIREMRGIWPHVLEEEGRVRASRSGVFHTTWCKVKFSEPREYETALDAFKEGRRPHKGRSDYPGCWLLPPRPKDGSK